MCPEYSPIINCTRPSVFILRSLQAIEYKSTSHKQVDEWDQFTATFRFNHPLTSSPNHSFLNTHIESSSSRGSTVNMSKEQSMAEKKHYADPYLQSLPIDPISTNDAIIEHEPHNQIHRRYQDQQHRYRSRRCKSNPRAPSVNIDRISQLHVRRYFTRWKPQEWNYASFVQHCRQLQGSYDDQSKIRALWLDMLNMLLSQDQDLHDQDPFTTSQIIEYLISSTRTPEIRGPKQTLEEQKQDMGSSVEQDDSTCRDSKSSKVRLHSISY